MVRIRGLGVERKRGSGRREESGRRERERDYMISLGHKTRR